MTLSHYDQIPAAADRVSCAAAEGCGESRLLLSRRSMLGVSAGLFTWAFMPRFAEAAGASADPRLVVVVLRGGLDPLSTLVPFGDPQYVKMRGELAIPASSTIKVDNFWGLHPALKNFAALYRDGDAAIVQATCVPLRNRSHFDAQDNLENGMPGRVPNATGWLNRVLSSLPAGAPIKARGAVEVGEAPVILRGAAPVLGWSPTRFVPKFPDRDRNAIRALYRERDPELLANLDRGLKADALASGFVDTEILSPLRKGFAGAGQLIRGASGPRIAVLSIEGYDTHIDQGGIKGLLADRLTELDLGLADLKKNAGASWSQTVVLIVTEFGRTVQTNGNSGTDHGVGTVALLAGGAVNGGKIFGDWPGIAPNQLFEGRDLRPTTDLRSVFKGVLRDHLGMPLSILDKSIFPESRGAPPMQDLLQSRTASLETDSDAAYFDAPVHQERAIAEYRRLYGGAPSSLA